MVIGGAISFLKGRKLKKQANQMTQSSMAQLQQLQASTTGANNAIAASFMGPSGIQANPTGIQPMQPGQLPAFAS